MSPHFESYCTSVITLIIAINVYNRKRDISDHSSFMVGKLKLIQVKTLCLQSHSQEMIKASFKDIAG